jgi:hypothetical protein
MTPLRVASLVTIGAAALEWEQYRTPIAWKHNLCGAQHHDFEFSHAVILEVSEI